MITNLQKDLQQIGILGEDENALMLFLQWRAIKENPFSVLCGKIGHRTIYYKIISYAKTLIHSILKLANALITSIANKLTENFIEDLEWTNAMLNHLQITNTRQN